MLPQYTLNIDEVRAARRKIDYTWYDDNMNSLQNKINLKYIKQYSV